MHESIVFCSNVHDVVVKKVYVSLSHLLMSFLLLFYENVGTGFFRFVTIDAFDRRTDRKALAIPCVALHVAR